MDQVARLTDWARKVTSDRFRSAVCALLVLTSALGFSAPAQPVTGGERWLRIGELPSNRSVTVQLKNGNRLKGSIEHFDGDGFVLRDTGGGRLVPVDRASVTNVSRRSRSRGAIYGLLVGFGAGFATGAIAGPYITDFGNPGAARRMKYGGAWGLFFGGVGAGVGALTGARIIVYR
jgi:hypothetical protein